MSKIKKKHNDVFKDAIQRREAIIKYSQLILEGTSKARMSELLEQEFGLTIKQSTYFLSNVREHISMITATNYDDIIPIHVELYEEISAKFEQLDHPQGQLAAWKSKEKIMNLLDEETNELIINNENNITINNGEIYDLNKLKPDKRKRLQSLLKKISHNG